MRIKLFVFLVLPIFCLGLSLKDLNRPYAQLLEEFTEKGRVDYKGIQTNPSLLNEIIAGIESVPREIYDRWSEEEKLAFWINVYNVTAIKIIVDNYPIQRLPSWRALVFPDNSIQQIRNVWNRKTIRVMEDELSLNHIEHYILRKDFKEPRIHFAIVCASTGCPVLRDEPYVAGKIDEQLTDQTEKFLADPEKAKYEDNKLYLSPIFKWFRDDFKKEYGSVQEFVVNFAPPEWRGEFGPETKIRFLNYDWSLNEQR